MQLYLITSNCFQECLHQFILCGHHLLLFPLTPDIIPSIFGVYYFVFQLYRNEMVLNSMVYIYCTFQINNEIRFFKSLSKLHRPEFGRMSFLVMV